MAAFQFMMTTFTIHGNVVEFKSYGPHPILHWYTPQLELYEVLIKSVVTKNLIVLPNGLKEQLLIFFKSRNANSVNTLPKAHSTQMHKADMRLLKIIWLQEMIPPLNGAIIKLSVIGQTGSP